MARRSLLERRAFQSKIHSEDVKPAEKWLGYLLGPAGALLLSVVGVSLLVFLASLAISVAMSRIPRLKKVI